MADENKPAFYPRVGNIKAKNFKSAQPAPFINDPRAMELPQYGDVDLSQPTKANLELGRRMTQRDADLKRQQSADTSPLEKAAGALQTVRLMGSALTQAINSLPTRIAKGDAAAEQFMQDRMYKPEQPLAYEYAGDVGEFLDRLETQYKLPPILPEAVALQYLSGPATSQAMRTAGKGAEQAGRAIESRMEPVVKGAFERGGLPREMVMAMGANTQSNVIKRKGGNFLTGSVDAALKPLKRNTPAGNDPAEMLRQMRERYTPEALANMQEGSRANIADNFTQLEKDVALNNWVDRNLGNYVKKEMATPEDPVRRLADEGISFLPQSELDRATWLSEHMEMVRRSEGFPGAGMANTDMGRGWENLADEAIAITSPAVANDEMLKANPWLSKLEPDDSVYRARPSDVSDLGFDHIMDVLREDIATGRIRPEQLNKISMEQAVRRTYEYDQELAKKMAEARMTSRAELPVYKEYPEGLKWVELKRPGDFAAESDAMGHSVRGYEPPEGDPDWTKGSGNSGYGGYGLGGWNAIKRGDAKVYSLVDAKGEPHVTVEVGAYRDQLRPDDLIPYKEAALEEAKKLPNGYTDYDVRDIEIRMAKENMPAFINQIKGKQNAKPKDDYLPFVQDFVKGGNWSDVRDFQNTGLDWRTTGPQGIFMQDDVKALEQAGYKVPKYLTTAEKDDLAGKLYELQTGKDYKTGLPKEPPTPDIPPDVLPDVPPDLEGMKRGGKVSISNNPDTMMLELGNKRMKEGGSEDDTKPYFGGAGTKKYAAAKKRAEQGDVNTLKDPRTYATVAGLMGERPDEMGFSVLHPDYQGVREAADPAFYAGTALGIAPLGKALNAPFAAIGKALDPAVGRFVTKTMERGGLGADILTDMGQGTRSYVHLPHTEKSPDPTVGTRYKRTDIGGLVPRKDLDIEKLDKSSVKVFPWDASDRNKLVTEVSDIPLTKPVLLEGGDNYMRDIKHVKKRIAGASNEGIANRIQDRIDQASVENQILGGTGKVFGFPIRMADKAEHASTFPTDIAMDLLKQGNLSRKELDDLTNELRGMSFEAKGKGYFQNVAPIDSPEFLVQLREGIKGNKEKGITSVTDMNLRRALMDRLSQKKFQKRLEYNYPDLIGSVIADELKGVPKGWVGNVSAELDPFSKIRPSKSSTYSHDFGGKYYASMPNMPVEFLMPNTFEGIYREMKALYPSAKPEALRNMAIGAMEKRKENISEMIGPRSIDAVKLYQEGLKQGEFDPNDIKQIYDYMRRKKFNLKLENVKKAEGGAVTGDDLILEERPL